VYDYVDGKVDWMAYGLPVEGDDGPFVGQAVTDAVIVDVGATVGEARRRLRGTSGEVLIVTHGRGLVVGEVDGEALAGSDDGDPLLEVMRPVPSTVRPSATVASLAGSSRERVVVTTSDGYLVGQAVLQPDQHDQHDHDDHDHDHDHDDDPDDDHDAALSGRLRLVERELDEVMEAVAAHFGDREPPEEELRNFLRDRLVAEGRSVEEADQFMAELDGQNSG